MGKFLLDFRLLLHNGFDLLLSGSLDRSNEGLVLGMLLHSELVSSKSASSVSLAAGLVSARLREFPLVLLAELVALAFGR
jgi:hypothetical protein